jgi:hypothetical protein
MLLPKQVSKMSFILKILSILNPVKKMCILSFALIISLSTHMAFGAQSSSENLSLADAQVLKFDELQVNNPTDELRLGITVFGQPLVLLLQRNELLLSKASKKLREREFSLYVGQLEGVANSWVRLSKIGNKYTGAFYDGNELWLIDSASAVNTALKGSEQLSAQAVSANESVIFRSSAISNLGMCALNDTRNQFNYQQLLNDIEPSAVTQAAGATKEIEILIVADTEYVASSGSDTDAQALSQMNVVDGIFSSQVGVQIAVTDIISLTTNGDLTSTDPETLVISFRDFTQEQVGNPGLAHLFTGKNLNGSVVGVAYVNAVCNSSSVGVSEAGNMSSIASLIAAHEIGHNFGAPHDRESGSACSGTGSGFLMNPSITGTDQFSSCSLEQMAPVIANASCLTDIELVVDEPPTIVSSANLNATVGVNYQYDEDNTLSASGTAPMVYELNFGPFGMQLDESGLLTWTPETSQEGQHSVQITATNSVGSDSQNFVVTVNAPSNLPVLDFNQNPPLSYGGNQDDDGSVTIEGGGATLAITGNRWQRIDLKYNVTSDTILEFDFRSTIQGEVHGIGFDNDLAISSDKTFKLYGSQNWGDATFEYSGSGDDEHFVIPVGEFYVGSMENIFFVMDHDVNNPNANSSFSNVHIYEDGAIPDDIPPLINSTANLSASIGNSYEYDEDSTVSSAGTAPFIFEVDAGPSGMTIDKNGLLSWMPDETQVGQHAVQISVSNDAGKDTQSFEISVAAPPVETVLDFNENPVLSYAGTQDVSGRVSIIDDGATLLLTGNRWKRVAFTYTVGVDTVLEFDFKSTLRGEVHGIGFDDDNAASEDKTFLLDGTQQWGNAAFKYTGNGEYQHFVLPIGEFYTGDMVNLFFVMDNDRNKPQSNSYFSNLQIRN